MTDAKEVGDETAVTHPSSTIDDAVRAASPADVCILALGEPRAWSGENASRAQFGLTDRQQHLLEAVAKTGKPIVVVLFCGRPLQLRAVLEKTDSLLVAWHPGIQAGNAIADLLFGDAAPAGRLTISFPSMWGNSLSITIDVGPGSPGVTNYRDPTSAPLFSFGFGLTYTSFAFGPGPAQPGQAGDRIQRSLRTQALASVRKSSSSTFVIRRAPKELGHSRSSEDFKRITLQPRESREVHFELTDEVLGFFGRDGDWQVDPGSFQVWIAPHAETGNPANYEH